MSSWGEWYSPWVSQGSGCCELSGRTPLCNTVWMVPLDWQTEVVVPLFKKGDWRVCSNFRCIILLSLTGKVYARVQVRRVHLWVEPAILEEQCMLVIKHWTSSSSCVGYFRVPNQFICILWRMQKTVFPHGVLREVQEYGSRLSYPCSTMARELYCQQ